MPSIWKTAVTQIILVADMGSVSEKRIAKVREMDSRFIGQAPNAQIPGGTMITSAQPAAGLTIAPNLINYTSVGRIPAREEFLGFYERMINETYFPEVVSGNVNITGNARIENAASAARDLTAFKDSIPDLEGIIGAAARVIGRKDGMLVDLTIENDFSGAASLLAYVKFAALKPSNWDEQRIRLQASLESVETIYYPFLEKLLAEGE